MSEHADIVVVHYPMGITALVWIDLATGMIATSHAGLREVLRRGIRDWEGHLVRPDDGPGFLVTVYDQFFLSGYAVHWLSAAFEKGERPLLSKGQANRCGRICCMDSG
jgi:hypothetical protein